VPSAVMLNILGRSSSMDDLSPLLTVAYNVPGASIHLYGKQESRKGRKMGHITVVGSSDFETRERLRLLLTALDDPNIDEYAPLPRPSHSAAQPLVGIVMGSDSDLPVMIAGARILDDFKIPYELTIVSAHRTPERLRAYAQSAASRGLRVIIAGAGGAAHLPGMVASMTPLPVIGVPVMGSSLDGVDSLYSIVQMPVCYLTPYLIDLENLLCVELQRGIPVATVAINNSTNAALLAARIIGTSVGHVLEDMGTYAKRLEGEVMAKVDRLEDVGWESYVGGMKR
jgi:phosphoribosylaminoimidazole carboxylase